MLISRFLSMTHFKIKLHEIENDTSGHTLMHQKKELRNWMIWSVQFSQHCHGPGKHNIVLLQLIITQHLPPSTLPNLYFTVRVPLEMVGFLTSNPADISPERRALIVA